MESSSSPQSSSTIIEGSEMKSQLFDPTLSNQIVINLPPFKTIKKKTPKLPKPPKISKRKLCSECKNKPVDETFNPLHSLFTNLLNNLNAVNTTKTIDSTSTTKKHMVSVSTQTDQQSHQSQQIIQTPRPQILNAHQSLLFQLTPSSMLMISFLRTFKGGLIHDDKLFLPICICIPNFYVHNIDVFSQQSKSTPSTPSTSVKYYFDKLLWTSMNHQDKYVVTNFKDHDTDKNYDFVDDKILTQQLSEPVDSILNIYFVASNFFQRNESSFHKLKSIQKYLVVVFSDIDLPQLQSTNILECKIQHFINVYSWLDHFFKSSSIMSVVSSLSSNDFNNQKTALSDLFEVLFDPNLEFLNRETSSMNSSHVLAIYKPVLKHLIHTFYGNAADFFKPTHMIFNHQQSSIETFNNTFFRSLSLSLLNEFPYDVNKREIRSEFLYPWTKNRMGTISFSDFVFVESYFLQIKDEGYNFIIDAIKPQNDISIDLECQNYEFCSDIYSFYQKNRILYHFPPKNEVD